MEAQALLKLQQMFDSQFPLGGFAHSWGIETYSHLGLDTQGLERLLRNMMTAGWGKLDLAAAALAHRKAGDALALERLAGEVDAMKVVAGPREASLQLGRRTLGLMHRLHPGVCPGVSPPHHCVVVGAVGAALGIPPRELLAAFAQSSAMACLAAAIRCMPLGPAQAQEILTRLQPGMLDAAENALADPEGAMFASMPGLDIRCHQQASLYSRLFQS